MLVITPVYTYKWNVSLYLGDQLFPLDLVECFRLLSLKWGPMTLTSTNGRNILVVVQRMLLASTTEETETMVMFTHAWTKCGIWESHSREIVHFGGKFLQFWEEMYHLDEYFGLFNSKNLFFTIFQGSFAFFPASLNVYHSNFPSNIWGNISELIPTGNATFSGL